MTVFHFIVNPSFLIEAGHPITIPKYQLSNLALKAEDFDRKNVTIIFPRGERLKGQLCRGEVGYGEYHQIQVTGKDRSLPRYIRLQDSLLIVLFRAGAQGYALLEYRE